ncbi:hypothetical protein H4582DRAFT_2205741 [Lactarius indigo]|nr:hypothetical protein H4582DRAFT_2205741 [Lactarius indigo]
MDYGSFLSEGGQVELAVETLEQGRALLWSEMRGLRTSVDQLRNVDPALADKFQDVSQALETVTTPVSLHEIRKLLQEQRRTLQDLQAIISQIRKLSGFESFLKAVPFHTLRNAASGGPIIVINHYFLYFSFVADVGISVAGLISDGATRATVIHGFQKHRLAHFACHGNPEPGKPFEAPFELHGGDRLTLLDIVRSRLAIAAVFAFISACHAAEHTDLEHSDEALHLTAAMQYCGFRSAVGTPWAMADTDGGMYLHTSMGTCSL